MVTENKRVGWHHRVIDMSLSKLREIVKDREACHAAVHGVAKIRTQQLSNNNDGLIVKFKFICIIHSLIYVMSKL